VGVAIIGATTNLANYALTTNQFDATDTIVAAGSGAVGGWIGGPLTNRLGRMVRPPPGIIDPQLAAQFAKPVALTRGIGGGTVAAYDYAHGISTSKCGCN
jgi:hypothetical protein